LPAIQVWCHLSEHALERALDLAECDGAPFPAPDLLQRYARHRTAHGALLAGILNLLAGQAPTPPAPPQPALEPPSGSEIRVERAVRINARPACQPPSAVKTSWPGSS
jgi:hypothetical protein